MHTPLRKLFSEEGCREGEILVDTEGLQELIARELRLGRFNEVHGVFEADEIPESDCASEIPEADYQHTVLPSEDATLLLRLEAERRSKELELRIQFYSRAVAVYLGRGYSQQRVGEILRLNLDQIKLLASRVGVK